MVLNCSVCSQPLVIRPTKIGSQDPKTLMTKTRKSKPLESYDTSKNFVDLNDAEVVATKCGHIFHKDCLKYSFAKQTQAAQAAQSHTQIKSTKPHGCPMCHKPVITSQLWPIIVRATPVELEQINMVKALKTKNVYLVEAIKEIRNNIHEKNFALQEARQRMFDCRLKLHGIDIETPSRERLELLENQQKELDRLVVKVAEQNSILTALIEKESMKGDSAQLSDSSANDDKANFTIGGIVKNFTASLFRREEAMRSARSSAVAESSPCNSSRTAKKDLRSNERDKRKDAYNLVPGTSTTPTESSFDDKTLESVARLTQKSKYFTSGLDFKGATMTKDLMTTHSNKPDKMSRRNTSQDK